MERLRIGNNITITWNVKRAGKDAELDGKTIQLFFTHPKGREEIKGFSVDGNTLIIPFSGLSQKVLGEYTLTIDARYASGERYMIQDKCGVFELVGMKEDSEEVNYEISL